MIRSTKAERFVLAVARPSVCSLLLALSNSFAMGCGAGADRPPPAAKDAAPDQAGDPRPGPAVPGSTSSNPMAKCRTRFGDGLMNQAFSASADGEGNFLLLVEVQGMVDIGSATIAGPAIAIVKLDPNCVPLGFRTIASGDEVGLGPRLIAADRRGNSYVAMPSLNNDRIGLFQVTPDGQLGWSRIFQSSVIAGATALTLGVDGSIFLAGTFTGQLELGNRFLVAPTAVFVAKFDENGNTIWGRSARVLDPTSGEDPAGLALDSAGNPVLWGGFSISAEFGGGEFVRRENDAMQGYLAKFDGASGSHMMSRSFRNLLTGRVVADAQDNLWINGKAQGLDLDLGCGPLSGSDSETFVAKMTADGRCLWSRTFANIEVFQLAVDRTGNVLFAGALTGRVDLGAGMIGSSTTGTDFLLASFDSSGQHRFARTWAGGWTQLARSPVVDPSGGIGLLGDFENAIDFGSGPLQTKPAPSGAGGPVPRDIFFVRY